MVDSLMFCFCVFLCVSLFSNWLLCLWPQVNNATARVMTNKKVANPYTNGKTAPPSSSFSPIPPSFSSSSLPSFLPPPLLPLLPPLSSFHLSTIPCSSSSPLFLAPLLSLFPVPPLHTFLNSCPLLLSFLTPSFLPSPLLPSQCLRKTLVHYGGSVLMFTQPR